MKYIAVVSDEKELYNPLNVIIESNLPQDSIGYFFENEEQVKKLILDTYGEGYDDGWFILNYINRFESVPTYNLEYRGDL